MNRKILNWLLFLAILFKGAYSNEEGHEGEHTEIEVFHVEWPRVEIPYLISVWILATTISKLIYYSSPWLKGILPESSVMIIIGLLLGIIFFVSDTHVTTLTPDIFFLYLLPPIIMEAGYFMPNRLFFDQLGTILLMAVVGTIFNMFTIGFTLWGLGELGAYGDAKPGMLETLLFGSLIAAVDPVAVLAVFEEIQVDAVLNIVVFGESLLNDGVAVVLYHMFEAFEEKKDEGITGGDIGKGLASFIVVAGGGTLIGIVIGYLCAIGTRFMNRARVLEPLLVLVMAYLSYLTAEVFHMSGILAITFCGITMKNYVQQNITENSSTTIRSAMHMLANCAEMTIFLFLGVYTVNFLDSPGTEEIYEWNWAFVFLTILCCIVFRILGVIILSAFANRFRIKKLKGIEQVVMMYGGLRSGVAFALVLLLHTEHAALFRTATITMVYWTVFVQGITIKPVVKLLKVKTRSHEDPSMVDRLTTRMMDLAKTGIMDIMGDNSEIPIRIRSFYKRFDDKFIKPLMLREKPVQEPKIFETFGTIVKSLALQEAKRATELSNFSSHHLSPNWNPKITLETVSEIKEGVDNPGFQNEEVSGNGGSKPVEGGSH